MSWNARPLGGRVTMFSLQIWEYRRVSRHLANFFLIILIDSLYLPVHKLFQKSGCLFYVVYYSNNSCSCMGIIKSQYKDLYGMYQLNDSLPWFGALEILVKLCVSDILLYPGVVLKLRWLVGLFPHWCIDEQWIKPRLFAVRIYRGL